MQVVILERLPTAVLVSEKAISGAGVLRHDLIISILQTLMITFSI